MTPAEPIVCFHEVSFAYDGATVLEDVNLAVAAGESISIVGPNGGGKTTLVRLMLGLLRPTRGEVRLFGQAPQRTRRRVGYMPQRADHDPQFPVTAMDIVLMGRLGGGGWRGPSAGTAGTIAGRPATPWPKSAWKTSPAALMRCSPAASGSGC